MVASKDEEVGGLAIFSAFSHSTFPLPGCVGLGHGGATSPKSHEASDLEASCGARAQGGWGWLQDQLSHPHLSAGSPEGSIPFYQAGRGPCEPARGDGGQGTSVLQWLLGSGTLFLQGPPGPTGVDSVVQ